MQYRQQQVKQIVNPNHCDFIANNMANSIYSEQNVPREAGNLYLGGVSTLNQQQIARLKINAVLSIMTEKQQRKSKLNKKIDELDFINKHITLMCHEQTKDISPYFIPAIEFVKQALMYNFNVLVHCRDGDSKSAAIVVACLMYRYKLDFQQAYKIVKQKRPCVQLPEYFQQQLVNYAQRLHQLK